MTTKTLLLFIVLLALPLSGCMTPPPKKTVIVTPEPSPNLEVLKVMVQLTEIKQELKTLRNAVEGLEFETENAKRRQQDLFQDLDRRLVDFERNQSVLATQTIETANNPNPSDDATGLTGEETLTAEPSNTEDRAATEVVVAADTTTSSSTDNTQEVNSGSVSLDAQNAYEQSFDLLKQSRYEDAILGFQQLVDIWPNSGLADDAYYWMSEARYVNREFEHALSGFRTVVSKYPNSQRIPETLLKIGYIQYDIGAYEDAAETFRDILARFPGHRVTVSAQTRLRRIEQTIQ